MAVLPLPFALRGVATFVRDTIRVDPDDRAWLVRWPIAIATGRFPRHEGHFDPGQRLANIAIAALLVALIVTGVALVFVKAGPAFALLAAVHRLATLAFTIVIGGHVIVALGVLPGYRGVWRSMQLGGRLRLDAARRPWPGWTDREVGRGHDVGGWYGRKCQCLQLSKARLTPDQQRATALARSTEQLVDLAELARAPDEGAGSHYVIFLLRPRLASRLRLVEAVS